MPQPKKEKLPYFSHDSDARQDRNLKLYIANTGLVGAGFYWSVLEDLYNNSYYLPFTEEDMILFANEFSVKNYPLSVDDVRFFVEQSLKWKLFDQSIYNDHDVLTSASCQRRYLKGCSRRVRVDFIDEFTLINLDEFYDEELKKSTLSIRCISLDEETLFILGDYEEPSSNGQSKKEKSEPEYETKYDFDNIERWDGKQPIDYAGCVKTWNQITGANSRITKSKRVDLKRVFRNYTGKECFNAMLVRNENEGIKDSRYKTDWSTLFGAKKLENLDKWVGRGNEWLENQNSLETVDDHLNQGWVTQKRYKKITDAAGMDFTDPTFCETKNVNGSLLYYPKFDY